MSLPTDAKERKGVPICTGVLDYFPDAIAAVARVSRAGNEQHHTDEPLHWDKSKSTDEADSLSRHLLQRGTLDTDGQRHSAKVAWRALALLQREIDTERANVKPCQACGGQYTAMEEYFDGRFYFCSQKCAARLACVSE